jgi:hypothetical protein
VISQNIFKTALFLAATAAIAWGTWRAVAIVYQWLDRWQQYLDRVDRR